jgi:hypothetical protein
MSLNSPTSTRLELELSLDKIMTSIEKTAVDSKNSELGIQFQFRHIVLFVSLLTMIIIQTTGGFLFLQKLSAEEGTDY